MIDGHCDVSRPSVFEGWIVDRSHPERRVELEILLNGIGVQGFVAEKYRDDLRQAGIGDGRHSFNADIPLEAVTGDVITVQATLRIKSTGEIMAGSERTIDLVETPMTFDQLRQINDLVLDGKMANGLVRARQTLIESRGSLEAGGKIALFAVNARILMASHRKILTELKAAGYAVVVINSDGRFGRGWLEFAGGLADVVVVKRDEGRDFSSWLTAFHLYRPEMESAEHLLFINESLAGPIRPLAPLFEKARLSGVGFWSLSDSYDVRYHLQSSFFILSQESVRSRPFREFIASYGYPNEKRAVIDEGEIGLSTCLLTAGVTSDVLCRYDHLCERWMSKYDDYLAEVASLTCFPKDVPHFDRHQKIWLSGGHIEHWTRWIQDVASSLLAGETRNAQHVFWRLMIDDYDYPFVKRELLFVNPAGVPDLSALFGMISHEDRSLLMSDIRHLSGRAPPLQKMPVRGSVNESV